MHTVKICCSPQKWYMSVPQFSLLVYFWKWIYIILVQRECVKCEKVP